MYLFIADIVLRYPKYEESIIASVKLTGNLLGCVSAMA